MARSLFFFYKASGGRVSDDARVAAGKQGPGPWAQEVLREVPVHGSRDGRRAPAAGARREAA